MQERLDEVKQNPLPYHYQAPELYGKVCDGQLLKILIQSPVTAISEENFKKIFDAMMKWPADFKPLRKVEKILQDKIKFLKKNKKLTGQPVN